MKKNNKIEPTFSIIIPMKNAEQYISTTLESIQNQNFEDLELLVIDDDSTDNSKAIAREWKLKHPNVNMKIYKTTVIGGGPGRSKECRT